MNYENDPREPIKEWEGIVEDVECGGCERTILSANAIFDGYANGNSDACWTCHFCDTENTTVFEAVEVGFEDCAHEGTMGTIDLETEMVICENCGYSEPADPYDIANHKSIRATGKALY